MCFLLSVVVKHPEAGLMVNNLKFVMCSVCCEIRRIQGFCPVVSRHCEMSGYGVPKSSVEHCGTFFFAIFVVVNNRVYIACQNKVFDVVSSKLRGCNSMVE